MPSQLLTPNQILNYFGKPKSIQGDEWIYQCPLCVDTHQDNLKYNCKTWILYCFAGHAAEIYDMVINHPNNKPERVTTIDKKEKREFFTQEQLKELYSYQNKCCKELINNPRALDYLYKKRGITKQTIELTGIGIDKDKSVWVFPINNMIHMIGFELRKSDFTPWIIDGKEQKCKRWPKGYTYACFSEINVFNPWTENLIILGGFIDAYILFQYLLDKDQVKYYHIIIPSMGEGCTEKLLHDFNFNPYKKRILFLDSDDRGKKIMKTIKGIEDNPEKKAKTEERNRINKEKFKSFEIKILNCGCKDFNEHYLRCII